MLKGLDGLISHETGIAVHVAEEPLNCVVLGTGKILETNTLNRVFSGTFSGS